MLKKFINDFGLGLVLGLVFFFVPSLLGSGGLLGWEIIVSILPFFKNSTWFLGVVYALIATAIYFFAIFHMGKNTSARLQAKSLSFFAGWYIAYLAFVFIGAFATSQGGF